MFTKIAFAAIAAAFVFAASAEVSIEKQKELSAMQERPRIVARKKIAVDGKAYIVEEWRNAPDGRQVRTNEVFCVVGVKQPTSWSKVKAELEAQVQAAEGDAKAMKDLKKIVKKAEKNISKVVKTIEKAKDKASSDDEIELYDALLSLLVVEGE